MSVATFSEDVDVGLWQKSGSLVCHSEVTCRCRISGCSQWFQHSCLVSILVSHALHKQPCDPVWESCSFCWVFFSQGLQYDAWLALEYYLPLSPPSLYITSSLSSSLWWQFLFCCVTDPLWSTQSSSLLCRDNSCHQVWRCQWQIFPRTLMLACDRKVVLWSVTLKWHTDVASLDVVSDFSIRAWSVY